MANVALIVDDTTSLSNGDIAVRDRLQSTLGHTVTLHNDHDAAPSLAGVNLVVIAPSCNNNAIGTKFDNATCGVFAMGIEPHSAMTPDGFAGGGNTNSTFFVEAPGDPLVGALTNTVDLLTGPPSDNYKYFETETIASGVVVVMLSGSPSNRLTLGRIPQGAELIGGVLAPTRRVYLGVSDPWPPLFSADGWTIFDNAVAYASAPPGQNPIANAGPDQEVDGGSLVQLDGSGSTDPDGTVTGYSWRVVSNTGPNITLSNPTIVNPTFTAPNTACTIVLGLRVTDNEGLQSPEDTVQIDVISHLIVRIAIGGSWVEKPQYVAKSGSWY